MSFKSASIRFVIIVLAAFPARTAERHNLVILLPKVLPSAAVDYARAPTLARLRYEGVYFKNSTAFFPTRDPSGPNDSGIHMEIAPVLAAAGRHYQYALVDTTARIERSLLVPGKTAEAQRSIAEIVHDLFPRFAATGRPFVFVYRFSDAEGNASLTAQGAAKHTGGPDKQALDEAVRTADEALGVVEAKLQELGLHEGTNIIVAAEGGSFVWKARATSSSRKLTQSVGDTVTLSQGFLAVDVAAALMKHDPGLSLFSSENDDERAEWGRGQYPESGGGVVAVIPTVPKVRVELRGDRGLVYLAEALSRVETRRLTQTIVKTLARQDYADELFVNERRVGLQRGTLALAHLQWCDDGLKRLPDMVVTFLSKGADCHQPLPCTTSIADTSLSEGQMLPGSSRRADTSNFMAARGPDFLRSLESEIPASNADVVRTAARLLQVSELLPDDLHARVLTESLRRREARGLK